MRYIVLDAETTFQLGEKNKKDPSPYNEHNRLVSLGYILKDDDVVVRRAYWFFYHDEGANNKQTAFKDIQAALDEAELLVAHNAKFDLQWLWAAGFRWDGPVYDTMIGEYILACGIVNISFSLEESARRRQLTLKKSDLIEQFMKDNVSFEHIPRDIVEEYGNGDITTTDELYIDQQRAFRSKPHLINVLQLMNDNCVVLSRMEKNGLKINIEALGEIEVSLTKELEDIEARLGEAVQYFMGATPINFDSNDDLSVFLYGRRPKDKKNWVKLFNIGTELRGAVRKQKRQPNMTLSHFRTLIRNHTDVVHKTTARSCDVCDGSGRILKRKVDGSHYKKPSRCPKCTGAGRVFSYTSDRAGLQLASYLRTGEASESGFKTNSDILERLDLEHKTAEDTGDAGHRVQTCLRDLTRRGAIKTYLGTYAAGLRRGLRSGHYVHPSFNQTITATARLSSSNPNFHNMPRGGTFEIKRCIQSRWEEGEILEADYRQLEYRVAVELAGDRAGLEDVLNGVDAHKFTAEVIFAEGDPEKYAAYDPADKKKYRQASKPHTFKPLYGGSQGTDRERAYYKAFLVKHSGIDEWQQRLQKEALTTKAIVTPSGREYAFPNVKRLAYGGVTFATQIKNYPVQGFATADIVPLGCILVDNILRAKGARSLLINSVHDCILLDVYPGERDLCIEALREGMLGVVEEMKRRWNYTFCTPLGIEIMVGPNWLDMEEIGEFSTEFKGAPWQ